MEIRVGELVMQAMRQAAQDAYPEECCGVLFGPVADEVSHAFRSIERAVPIRNHHPGARDRRYLISAEELTRAHARYAGDGLEAVGFYHSHPDHPAIPSETDRVGAWPWYLYLIVPVAKAAPGVPRGWVLRADRSAFDEVPVHTPSYRWV